MQCLNDFQQIKIEDILPFFPDFVTIDHFKVWRRLIVAMLMENKQTYFNCRIFIRTQSVRLWKSTTSTSMNWRTKCWFVSFATALLYPNTLSMAFHCVECNFLLGSDRKCGKYSTRYTWHEKQVFKLVFNEINVFYSGRIFYSRGGY